MKKRKLEVNMDMTSESKSVGGKTRLRAKESFVAVLLWVSPREAGAAHRGTTLGWGKDLVLDHASESNVKGA